MIWRTNMHTSRPRRHRLVCLLLISLVLPACARDVFPERVYPMAEGWGRGATGGKGQTIRSVTSLADSGRGTARACLERPNSICVPTVSGYIDLTTNILIRENVTWAGCVGPDEGLTFRFTAAPPENDMSVRTATGFLLTKA